jgi:hypothetical protein
LKKKLRIGLDFDDVIACSHALKPVIAKKMFGVDVAPELLSRKRIGESGLTQDQYSAVKEELYHGNYDIAPVRDASLYIQILLDKGDLVEVVTARDGITLDKAIKWMQGPPIPPLSMNGVGYGVSKLAACEGFDLYVDDDLEKLLPMIGKVPHLLLFSWPFNAHEQAPEEIRRVDSWWDIYQYVRYEI